MVLEYLGTVQLPGTCTRFHVPRYTYVTRIYVMFRVLLVSGSRMETTNGGRKDALSHVAVASACCLLMLACFQRQHANSTERRPVIPR